MPKEKEKPKFGKSTTKSTTKNDKLLNTLSQEGTVSALCFDDHNVDPLLIIGFESGAISMFKIVLGLNDEKQKVLQTVKLFSA